MPISVSLLKIEEVAVTAVAPFATSSWRLFGMVFTSASKWTDHVLARLCRVKALHLLSGVVSFPEARTHLKEALRICDEMDDIDQVQIKTNVDQMLRDNNINQRQLKVEELKLSKSTITELREKTYMLQQMDLEEEQKRKESGESDDIVDPGQERSWDRPEDIIEFVIPMGISLLLVHHKVAPSASPTRPPIRSTDPERCPHIQTAANSFSLRF